MRGDGLRREGRVCHIRGEGTVQLGRASAQELCQVEIVAHQILGEGTGLGLGQAQDGRQVLDIGVQPLALGQQALVVATQRSEGVAPRVALVGYELVEHGHGRGLVVAPGPAVLEGAAQSGDVREAGPLREEAPDLQVGVLAGFHLAEELHDEAVVEHQRAVRLVGPRDVHFEGHTVGRRRAPEAAEGRNRMPDQRSLALQAAALGDDVEQVGPERWHHRCLIEDGLGVTTGSAQHGHEGVGEIADQGIGLVSFGDAERNDIRLRLAFGIGDREKRHRDAVGQGNGRTDP